MSWQGGTEIIIDMLSLHSCDWPLASSLTLPPSIVLIAETCPENNLHTEFSYCSTEVIPTSAHHPLDFGLLTRYISGSKDQLSGLIPYNLLNDIDPSKFHSALQIY